MPKKRLHHFFITLICLGLSGCLAVNQPNPFQTSLIQNRVWLLISDSNTLAFSYDPYSLRKEADGIWVFYLRADNKQNGQILGPNVTRINCNANSYSEDGPALGSSYYQRSFKTIPQGSALAITKERICGSRWPYDNQIYYYLVKSSAAPFLEFWLRGNEVRRKGNKSEVLMAYNNPSTGTASPVQVVADCANQTISEYDLIAGKYLGNLLSVQPMTNSIAAVIYDRACNTSRNYMTQLRIDDPNRSQNPSATKLQEAERRCESLGIARGTQPFSVCVKQLSSN
jgi:hypothetical protein